VSNSTLGHRGVLLLDEAAEFHPAALEALRQPLEAGCVILHRSGGAVTYPARFLLVMAANPCPCAAPRARDCVCVSTVRRRYQQRLSGPLRDRIDLRLDVDPVARADLSNEAAAGESSATVAARVVAARQASHVRWRFLGRSLNSDVPGVVLRRPPYRPAAPALRSLDVAVEQGLLTARGYYRALRIAWTVADLNGHQAPDAGDIAEALFLRSGRTGMAA
jgi:magnesium chelatase family protein